MPAWLTIVTSIVSVMQVLLPEIEALIKQINPPAAGMQASADTAKLAAMMKAHHDMATNCAAIIAANMP